MRKLIEEFQDIFQAPKELLPERAFDHAIHLEALSKLVNMKPYRALNAITINDKFPIPMAEELFDEVGGAQFFSKLDLLSGYHQIRVRASDVPKMAFRTHEGHYEFLVMPFGLTNAPSTFQATMNEVFKSSLRIQMCVWTRNSRLFGDVVTRERLAVDPQKIEAIRIWPQPTGVKGVRSFLGISGYYRKFIKGFATIAAPLSDLLRKEAFFTWTDTAQVAFDKLKQCLWTSPVLGLPDFTKNFVVEIDTSRVGIGAVLHQGGKPLAFYSKKLSPRIQATSMYHREMFAITQSVGKWRQYLLGRKFVIITDQRSLRKLNQQTIQTPEQ
ncbi:hypothetical protein CXB51_023201 [Gossypium anomalum]|uniref:Reverse transcriptase/retrotransposon-derived protein RNase H-like domain-containing protein n=1 Tax=Gossypium anomalum TaxID=47600 RepID=A0A8J5YKY3_9ROSI|nr:hypothetical protein CXB51_023201 [Gossypium anomalum]